MEHSPKLTAALRILVIAVTAATLIGGASQPAVRPVTGIDDITGKWAGMADINRQFFHFYLAINPNRSLKIDYGSITRWGTVTVADGKATWDAGTWSGTFTLYGQGPNRVLEMKDNWFTLYVQLRPQR